MASCPRGDVHHSRQLVLCSRAVVLYCHCLHLHLLLLLVCVLLLALGAFVAGGHVLVTLSNVMCKPTLGSPHAVPADEELARGGRGTGTLVVWRGAISSCSLLVPSLRAPHSAAWLWPGSTLQCRLLLPRQGRGTRDLDGGLPCLAPRLWLIPLPLCKLHRLLVRRCGAWRSCFVCSAGCSTSRHLNLERVLPAHQVLLVGFWAIACDTTNRTVEICILCQGGSTPLLLAGRSRLRGLVWVLVVGL
mmetsp:Transcript_33812/g.74969  ORF Transcript_33812/g.74969 Transcript_33812/m.74969 type:complete len:246 (-) Transcript_33812:241-978(-)